MDQKTNVFIQLTETFTFTSKHHRKGKFPGLIAFQDYVPSFMIFKDVLAKNQINYIGQKRKLPRLSDLLMLASGCSFYLEVGNSLIACNYRGCTNFEISKLV